MGVPEGKFPLGQPFSTEQAPVFEGDKVGTNVFPEGEARGRIAARLNFHSSQIGGSYRFQLDDRIRRRKTAL